MLSNMFRVPVPHPPLRRPTTVSLVAVSVFDLPTLTELFNAGYSGYQFPVRLSDEAFQDHVTLYDIDLESSRAVVADGPVAFALLGRRGDAGWIGGMGTRPAYRRRGLGERTLVAAIEAARASGCREIGLEVLEANEAATWLYRKLGFRLVRDLAVWSLPASANAQPATASVVDIDRAQGWIATHRRDAGPWQRADQTIAALQRRGIALTGLLIERRGEIAAAAIVREQDQRVAVMQIAALDEAAASEILVAAAAGRSLTLTNVPLDDPASRAIDQLGADRVAVQHEMSLTL
jgi:ribosomal protein S18 acetylase RimI-like enzyme